MHIKTITEEWVTHRGWGGRTTLSPFRTLLSPQHSHISGAPKEFHCPVSLHQSLPPWYKQWEGYGPQIRNRMQGIFRKRSSAFFNIFFHMCFKREKRREAQQPGYELSGELSNPNHLHLQKTVFPWSALHAPARVLAEGWTPVSRDMLMKLSL